jgi:hypothetical protein
MAAESVVPPGMPATEWHELGRDALARVLVEASLNNEPEEVVLEWAREVLQLHDRIAVSSTLESIEEKK